MGQKRVKRTWKYMDATAEEIVEVAKIVLTKACAVRREEAPDETVQGMENDPGCYTFVVFIIRGRLPHIIWMLTHVGDELRALL